MDYKQATTVLIQLVKSEKLTTEEKEAVGSALGVLAWASLSKSTLENRKAKRDKQAEW